MDESDNRFANRLVLLLIITGVVIAMLWPSIDDVGSPASVLGRTQSEILENPTGEDRGLSVFEGTGEAKSDDKK